MRVALLAGGTGGAKLAAGMQELVGDELTVIANTADDCEVHGLHVSPDPDLITYWLADMIDSERGWGIKGDSFTVHEQLERLGAPGWFSLSDRDLATCLYRTHFIAEGGTLTLAQAQIAAGLGIRSRVLPMCEQRVRTRVATAEGWRGLQEYLILDSGRAAVTAVELEGIAEASPTPEVLEAIEGAEAIVIGPSNPVISIGPILALPGLRQAILDSPAPVVGVSPVVGGEIVKGPTASFLEAVGRPVSHAGVASLYSGVLDGFVIDERTDAPSEPELELRVTRTLMRNQSERLGLSREVVELAEELA